MFTLKQHTAHLNSTQANTNLFRYGVLLIGTENVHFELLFHVKLFFWRLLCLFERAEKANLSSSQQHCFNLFKSCDFIFVLYIQCIPFHAMSAKVHIMHKIVQRAIWQPEFNHLKMSKKNVTRVNINNYVEVVYFKVENIEFLTI